MSPETTSGRTEMSVSGVERASRALASPPPAQPGRAEQELARISHRLLVLDADRIEEAVREELAATAVLAGCDRSYLYFLDPVRPTSVWHASWCADGTPGSPPPTDASRLGWARDRMLAGEVFHCHASRPLPEAARDDRATLEARGVQASLAIPMHAGKRLIGAQVFERVHRDCGWTEVEIATLRTAGELLVSALKRWAAECALRESEERFRTITEYATELIAEFDDRGRYCYVSPAYATLLGHPPETLLGQVGNVLIHPDDVEGSRQTFIRSFVEGNPSYSIHRLRHADGTWRWFENTGQAYRLASGQRRFVSIGHDVTQRIESQKALEHQLDLERTVARLSRRLLAVVDDRIEDEITASLKETAGLAGADRAYIARFPSGAGDPGAYHEWCDKIAPQRPMRRSWSEARLRRGETLCYPDVQRLPPEAAEERAAVLERGVTSFLSIPVHHAGELAGVIGFESLTPCSWSEHEIRLIGLIGEILVSAMQRHLSERALRESQLELLQSQKLEAVGRLAGGIAHDFNNLLTVILGLSRPLLESVHPDSELADDLGDIHHAAERAAALTRQLLTFSRRQPVERQVVDLNANLVALRPLLERMLGPDVTLDWRLSEGAAWVRGDGHQFEQVVVNLAANARDAMPGGGRLEIGTGIQVIDDAAARQLRLPGAGDYVLLVASDSGEGMDQRTRRRIFDPFFTTKDPGKGTGLGLSIVYSVVEQADGSIEIDSEPGQGTRFRIWLPSVSEDGPAGPPQPASSHSGGTECVLFVEDEPAVRRLGRRILERAGYRVVEASDGEAALAALQASGESIHAVVTDVVMPRLAGGELARRLRESDPGLPVLFVSGHPDDPSRHIDLPEAELLHKPYTADALLGRLRALLDRPRD
jgi:PAS domain S-box-containing protein